MSFDSYIFVFAFLPVVFIIYQVLRATRFANVFLSVASAVFYAWLALWYLVPLLISSVVDYFIGRRMADETDSVLRKRLLVISVVVNLGMLSVFKYTGWLSAELSSAAALLGFSLSTVTLGLPPGISFYTFQTMSYTIDIYRGSFRPRRSIIDYFAFVSFFPQLIAGPIERASHLIPQIESRRPRVSAEVASGALFMILFGLFQKTVLADNFGRIVEFAARGIDPSGETPLAPGLGLVFAYAFAFQIYCDFAAYSTIARGTARLFGIDLMRNFATPYFSVNPSEFWQRWHISLSTWLRDYLYIPLGGNRHGRLATLRNLMITMALGGLWHGAGFFFILWGLWHGLLLVVYRLLPIDVYLESRFGRFGRILSTILFFHLVCFGWIFFRATPEQFWPIVESIVSVPAALLAVPAHLGEYWSELAPLAASMGILQGAFSFAMDHVDHTLAYLSWGLVIFGVPALVTDYAGYRRDCEFADLWHRMSTWTRLAWVVALVYGIQFFARREANEFIYFQF